MFLVLNLLGSSNQISNNSKWRNPFAKITFADTRAKRVSMTTRKIHANSTNSAHSAGARIKLLTQASRHRSENGKRFCSCGRKPTCTFLFAVFTALNLSLAIVCVRWFSCQLVANVAEISECKQELLWNIHNCTNLCCVVKLRFRWCCRLAVLSIVTRDPRYILLVQDLGDEKFSQFDVV